MRCVAGAICDLAIVEEQSWAATSSIYKKYTEIVSKTEKSLSYRRVSDLLVELENSGLVVSRAYSRGRNGYGKEYKLTVSPDLVGPAVDQEYFDSLVKDKEIMDKTKEIQKEMKSLGRKPNWRLYSKLLGEI
jgi:cell division control protein 6